MNTVQRIAKNAGVLLFAQIASYILGFFFIIQTLRKFDQNASQQTLRKFDQNASQQTLRKFDQNALFFRACFYWNIWCVC